MQQNYFTAVMLPAARHPKPNFFQCNRLAWQYLWLPFGWDGKARNDKFPAKNCTWVL